MTMSMTGYGRSQQLIGGRDITVELRAVNHRYFECAVRAPRSYSYLEEKLKSYVQSRVSRGKVDISVTVQNVEVAATEVQINEQLAEAYLTALREMGKKLDIADDVTVTAMARFSDIFTVRRVQEDEDEIWALVSQVAEEAVDRFLEMRAIEGERLKQDILSRGAHIGEMV